MMLLVNSPTKTSFSQVLIQFRITGGTQNPWYDASSDSIVYFFTPKLADGTHEIDITVTTANVTNPYIIDFFLVTPNANGAGPSGVVTSRNVPTPGSPTSSPSTVPIVTSQATPVGPIVGGVVGGIAGIALLIFGLWYFLRRRSGGQAYYFEKPTPGDILAGEGPSPSILLSRRRH